MLDCFKEKRIVSKDVLRLVLSAELWASIAVYLRARDLRHWKTALTAYFTIGMIEWVVRREIFITGSRIYKSGGSPSWPATWGKKRKRSIRRTRTRNEEGTMTGMRSAIVRRLWKWWASRFCHLLSHFHTGHVASGLMQDCCEQVRKVFRNQAEFFFEEQWRDDGMLNHYWWDCRPRRWWRTSRRVVQRDMGTQTRKIRLGTLKFQSGLCGVRKSRSSCRRVQTCGTSPPRQRGSGKRSAWCVL